MKHFCVLLMVVAAVDCWRLSDLAREEWQIFKLEHKKRYHNASQELHRLRIYLNRRLVIAKHNRRYRRGLESYSLKTNQFSDMTHQEYLKIATGFIPASRGTSKNPAMMSVSLANVIITETVNWTQLGAVSAVHRQKNCNSCWAFSAAGALEGQLFIKNKKRRDSNTLSLVPLSAQNLVDCSKANKACLGGDMVTAFEYVRDNKGIEIEKYYPYEDRNDTCRYNPQHSGGYDIGYFEIPAGDEEELKQAVAMKGPVSVAVNSSSDEFSLYSKGVYYNKKCTNDINHARTIPCGFLVYLKAIIIRHHSKQMLLVGYGTDEKEGDYWLLKNTYGTTWGEDGYMRLARNRGNHCGIASFASYPILPA